MNKNLIIYHGNCADGFGAAWVAWKYFTTFFPDEKLEFLPAVYQKTPVPKVDKHTTVFILDFSFPVLDTLALCEKANRVKIIDHHKSAWENHRNVSHEVLDMDFNMEHSGAMLAWQHFFTGQEPPPLLKHIEDRDLWKFQLEGTREIQANLFSWPYDFEVWDKLMAMDEAMLEGFMLQGSAINRKHFKDIHEFLNVSVRWILLAGVEMPVVNVPYMWGSDAAHILAENSPSNMAAYYWDGTDGRNFGIRSVRGVDCNLVARNYGGGGHMGAAGFKVSYEQAEDIRLASLHHFAGRLTSTDPYLQTK